MIPADIFDFVYKLAITIIGSAITLWAVKTTYKQYWPIVRPFWRKVWSWFQGKVLKEHEAEEEAIHQQLQAQIEEVKQC